MPRHYLIGIVGAALLLAVVALAAIPGAPLSGLFHPEAASQKVMVVTPTLLANEVKSIDATVLQEIADKGKSIADAKPAAAEAKGGKPAAKDKPGEPAPVDPKLAAEKRSADLKMVFGAMEDSLGNAIGQRLQESGRFRLVSNSAVIDALQVYDKKNGGAVASGAKAGNLFSFAASAVSNGGSKGQAAVNQNSESSGYQHGLTNIAHNVSADLVMVVSIGDPSFDVGTVQAEGGSPARIVLRAQPIVNCEMFETHRNGGAWRYSELLPQAITETLVLENEAAPGARLLATYNRLIDRLDKAVSQRVLAWALDKVAPARVVALDDGAVEINRGANDGLTVGAILPVEREEGDVLREGADAKGEGGRVLERATVPVGSISIDSVQKDIARGSVMPGGGRPAKNDIVRIETAVTSAPAAGSQAEAAGGPLGRMATLQAGAAAGPPRRANVAIDNIIVTSGGKTVDSQPMALALSEALQKDRRVSILPRADLDKVMLERRLNQRATDNYDNAPDVGLAASGYLIVGEFKVTSQKHANTIGLGDVKRVVSTSTSETLSGDLRANSMDGKLVASVHVTANGGGLDGLAQAAARDLLLELFPMRVVQVGPGPGMVTLDRGTDGGVKVGDVVHLYSRGAKVVDPETGAVLSEGARTYVGDVVVSDVDPGGGISEARQVGAAFQPQVGYAAYRGPVNGQTAPSASSGAARLRRHAASGSKSADEPAGLHW